MTIQSSPSLMPETLVIHSPHRFVMRQPIFSPEKRVFGYELLYRDGLAACFAPSGPEQGTASSVNSSILMGFHMLCNGSRAFLPCNLDVLKNDYVTLLPPELTVVELAEDIAVDETVEAACKRLKEAGYMIALNRFAVDDPRAPLTALADILKVDFELLGIEKSTALLNKYQKQCRLLADNLKSQESFNTAKKLGFSFFQGNFFRNPDVLPVSHNSVNRVKYFRMLEATSLPDLDLAAIERLVMSEPSASYRLLRYLNSSRFSFATEISTIKQALALLGEREIRHWVRLTATLCAGQSKPSALLLSALTRARFCELLGSQMGMDDSNLFLMGILSLMDVILDMTMARVVEGLPLTQDCRAILLGGESRLRPIYLLMLAQESGDWKSLNALTKEYRLDEVALAKDYWQAMQWAQELMGQ